MNLIESNILNDFFVIVNAESKYGNLSTVEPDVTGIDNLKQDDVCVYYDYCLDDMPEEDYNDWESWFDQMLKRIDLIMYSIGYSYVDENDGSGGGLIYGARVYRK